MASILSILSLLFVLCYFAAAQTPGFANIYLYSDSQCANSSGSAVSPVGCTALRDADGNTAYGYFSCTGRDQAPFYSCPTSDCEIGCTIVAAYGGDNCVAFPLVPGLYARALCAPSIPAFASPTIQYFAETNCSGQVYLTATPSTTACLFGDQYMCQFDTNQLSVIQCADPLCETSCAPLDNIPLNKDTCYNGRKISCVNAAGLVMSLGSFVLLATALLLLAL